MSGRSCINDSRMLIAIALIACLASSCVRSKPVDNHSADNPATEDATSINQTDVDVPNGADKLDVDLDLLCGRNWVHSHEEQTSPEQQVYRREDFNFPPSRWRMKFIFEKDGKCQWYYLSPDDGHCFKPGQWSAVTGQKNTIKISGNNEVVYQITELTDQVLRMTKLDKNDIQ